MCWPTKFTYCTEMSIPECIHAIGALPHEFGKDSYNPQFYDCEKLTDSALWITFKGARYGRYCRCVYLAKMQLWRGKTLIVMEYQRIGLNFLPLVSTYILDTFLGQKVGAVRMENIE